ncbi:CCR4-NOT transcription complex subunit 1 [Dermatophagoides farinae]|uniref:CCR4-NOT transcription complex subunit 1 n=1 Tax=Dermatophagoides farinae TaxID=6954 RepID=A0A922LAL5_DERFA|nr:CCR4-NOT transcription complex subunit 1 [Dermatophagoides farinae]
MESDSRKSPEIEQCVDDDDLSKNLNFDFSLDTVSICETLFNCCQSSEFANLANFIKGCHENSIELNHFLALIDSYLFVQKYSTSSSFNFESFLKFCETYYPNKNGIENIGRIFFTILWNHNFDFQFDFIEYCIENNKITSIFEACSNINLNKEVPEWIKCLNEQIDLALICWKYNALYWILLELSRKEKLLPKIENLFVKIPLEKCPDLLIFALIEQSGVNNPEHNKLSRSLMMNAIKKIIYPGSNTTYHNNSNLIIPKLWSAGNAGPSMNSSTLTANQKILLESLVDLYNQATSPDEQTNKLLRILEISQDLKALNYLLNDSSYLFIIDLASVASRREYLKLDKWINDKLKTIGQPFSDACKLYVQQRSFKPETNKKLTTPSHRETLSTITSCLENYYSMIKEATYYTNMKDMFKIYAELDSANNNNKKEPNEEIRYCSKSSSSNYYHSLNDNLFDKEVQQKATGFLKNILTQSNLEPVKYEKIFNLFESMKQSKDQQKVFNCIVQTLLKELDFLSKYQKNELLNIGELIGGIIDRSLVDTNLLSFILQKLYYIINASKKDQKLLYFVVRVIDRCETRLQKYPALCEKLLSSDLLKFQNSSLKREHSSQLSNNQEFLFKERLNFIFNNLDSNNLQMAATQLIQDCKENIGNYDLLSDCLTCRAINETNHHELFYDLLETINLIDIFDSVAVNSYKKIRMYLLRIESSDLNRKLYSAGKWIGMITLQRNKPILSLYLDLHCLLIEAEAKNLSFHVVPFIVQVLNSCGKSKVFQPPNPWLMTLLQLLTEIYIKPDCKLKIKFEIEKLYKVLQLELNDYKVICQQINPNAIQEWLSNWAETPGMLVTTIEILVRKDFASEPDPEKLRNAAIDFTRFALTGYVLMTCNESLSGSIADKLCEFLCKEFKLNQSMCDKKFIEDTITQIVNENISPCIMFIEKCLIKKAVEEICFRIQPDIEKRLKAKAIGKKYINKNYFNNIPIKSTFYSTFDSSKLKMKRMPTSTSPEHNSDSNLIEKNVQTYSFDLLPSNATEEMKVEAILGTWFHFIYEGQNNHEDIQNFIFQTGFFKGEESLYKFLKLCFNLCYERCQQALEAARSSDKNLSKIHLKCFTVLDAFIYLALFLIKYETIEFKINVLDRFLTDLSEKVHLEHKTNIQKFYPLCYYRVMVLFFLEFNNELVTSNSSRINNLAKIPNIHCMNTKLSLMQIFFDFLKSMSPLKLTSFTFAWLEFISHRSFIGHCLNGLNAKGLWNNYYFLIRDLLEFEKTFFQTNQIESESFKYLHKGTVKLFLLLLHDFPDFLSQFSFLICDNLPYNSFQLHNIVLSASPQAYHLPSPLSSSLSLENFNKIINSFDGNFTTESPFKIHIDVFFKTGQLFHLKKLQPYFDSAKCKQTEIEYINKILYSITEHVLKENRDVNMANIGKEPSLNMIKCLLEFFGPERLYYLFFAMVNHLRFPNIDTKYFISLLLYFFKEFDQLKEFIFRVLLERLVAIGPRPWGLYYFVKELTNNPDYNFKEFLINYNQHGLSEVCGKMGLFPK